MSKRIIAQDVAEGKATFIGDRDRDWIIEFSGNKEIDNKAILSISKLQEFTEDVNRYTIYRFSNLNQLYER